MDVSDQLQTPDRITPRENPSVPINRGGCGLRQTPTQTKCIIVQNYVRNFRSLPLSRSRCRWEANIKICRL